MMHIAREARELQTLLASIKIPLSPQNSLPE
jgi:hypothetical protein